MDISLSQRHALVCGASRGIGAAIATELAALGATITAFARDADALKSVVDTLSTAQGQRHMILVGDMLDTEQLRSTIKTIESPVNILINNSGGPAPGPIATATDEHLINGFLQHVIASQTLVRQLLPAMKVSGYGRIINIISTSIRQPIKGLGVSNTIRGAVASWSKTLATELAPTTITVNNVLPGYTNTDRLQSILKIRAEKSNCTVAEATSAALTEVPMGRFATAAEIAEAVAFLASPSAAYITGINITVDGGRTSSL